MTVDHQKQTTSKRPFNTRAFVTAMITLTGLGLPFTGLANHLYQQDTLLFARHCWMAVHNVLGILFVVFAVWHVILNRRSLSRQLKGRLNRSMMLSREAVLAGTVVIVSLLGFIGHGLVL